MRGAWVVLLPITLGGCLPPAVTVASLAADGVSYAANGKSVTDNGMSAVKQEDCAGWHFFVGRAICEDPQHPVPPAPLEAHDGTRDGKNLMVASAPPVLASPSAAPVPASAAGTYPGRYLLIGSFLARGNAERLAAAYPDYRPRILSVHQHGSEFHRVVLGPLDESQLATLRQRGVTGTALSPAEAMPPVIEASLSR